MSKITRYTGNLRAFGSNAQGLERTLFGETKQADDLTSQITAAFLRGWGVVGPSENPSLEDFNAAMYTMSQFIAYQHQMGVPEWDSAQEYYIGSLCVRGGETYLSLADGNIGSAPPSAKWTTVLTAKNGIASLALGTAAKRNVDATLINGIPDMSSFRGNALSNGYLQIPIIGAGGGGQSLIIQWGNTPTAPNSIASYNVNIAFPNTIIFAVGNRWANGSNASMNVKPFNTQQIQIQNFAPSGSYEVCSWIAIGY